MKDFKCLKFFDKFKWLFEKMGADYSVMRRILQVKLTLDSRNVPTIIQNNKSKKGNESGGRALSYIMYVLLGLFFIYFVISKSYYTFNMSIVFGFIMFMVMTSLISDFSNVLLDVRDREIIYSKPVNSKTLSLARTLHILIYMVNITFAVSGPALIVSLIRQGILFFILFLFEIIIADIFIVVLTTLLYMLILKFFDGEKLKDIINYFQIILSIILVIGYQLVGRIFTLVKFNTVFMPKPWHYLIIPVWFGASFDLIINGIINIHYIIFSILAIFVPLISILIYLKFSKSFMENLNKLKNNGSKALKSKKGISYMLSNLVCFKKEEKAAFRFTTSMLKHEREFKLKVYPSLGMSIVFPFIFMLNNGGSFKNISSSHQYLFIYFTALMLPSIVMGIKYSTKYNASFIYVTCPIKDKSSILKGAVKSFIVNLVSPVYIFISIIFIFIFGIRILPDLFLVFLNILFFTAFCISTMKKEMPFSLPYGVGSGSNVGIMFMLMSIVGVLAGVHFASLLVWYGIYIYMAVVLVLNLIFWRKAFKLA